MRTCWRCLKKTATHGDCQWCQLPEGVKEYIPVDPNRWKKRISAFCVIGAGLTAVLAGYVNDPILRVAVLIMFGVTAIGGFYSGWAWGGKRRG